ncbi:MAG: bifunctional diaminohydroxyphosphoribosylaminopyrimidine deaminase/5-amino-6-(5-phosphoribosylamino)uracil reductase RibD [Planctomycetia bacterium]|nr:bifunctional diaminohydroxyphosphoribosylaminopyrimidine deaminase/5-amino-6-(5-phosphoribosylamino)uracil reductase RibD [Planctomycetia bacterium]
MDQALRLAERGRGEVEPNPMVGCVIAQGCEIIGEGWHRRFGGPHAEIEALKVAGERARNATMVVTLEPCCHHGKTPPCTEAILRAGIRRVVVAMRDPFGKVSGRGIEQLRSSGTEVTEGVCEMASRKLNAPYLKRLRTGRPWVIAKWAMTADGRIATHTGSSRWISCDRSRQLVHEIRGRVDAIMVGRETARADDPSLTARPEDSTKLRRRATRIVFDTRGTLASSGRLVRTAREIPVLVVVGTAAHVNDVKRLERAGCEVLICRCGTHVGRLGELLDELGRRGMTNVFVEGGGRLLGGLFDARQIDEVHIFIAPKMVGGEAAPNPIDGEGIALMEAATTLEDFRWTPVGTDMYLSGRVIHRSQPACVAPDTAPDL